MTITNTANTSTANTQAQQAPQICCFDSGEAYTGAKNNALVFGYTMPSVRVPKAETNYVYPDWARDIIKWLQASTPQGQDNTQVYNEPLYVFGPTGCGKTSCIKQILSRINVPVYEVTGHSRLEFVDLCGHHTLTNGSMHYAYGPLALAMRDGGVFLLNEIDLLDPSTSAGLNSILDGSPLVLADNGGEVIKPHPLFRFIATANSNGGSDDTGLYQGVLRQNLAFMDRFLLTKATYLPHDVEVMIVSKATPSLSEDLVDKLVTYANDVRHLFEETSVGIGIDITLSTRTLIRWARLIEANKDIANTTNVIAYALDRALGHRASTSAKPTLDELLQRLFGDSKIDNTTDSTDK